MTGVQLSDQSRWDEVYGGEMLSKLAASPEEFVYRLEKLPNHKQFLVKSLPDLRGRKVLDVGAGMGELSVAMAKLGAATIGIDIGPQLVNVARKVTELNQVQCEFLVGSIHELPFQEKTFDYVVGNAILHHLPVEGVVESLREAHRVLKPGGSAYFMEPIENSKVFDFLQNLIPVGKPGHDQYRPSILNRKRWKQFLAELDHRAMTDSELIEAGSPFASVHLRYHGWAMRLCRVIPGKLPQQIFKFTDYFLTHPFSPVKRMSSLVLVEYRKSMDA